MLWYLTCLILCTSLMYGASGQSCGDNIDVIPNNEVEVTTPNFPMLYDNNLNCTWVFCSVNPTHVIVLEFYIFQVERDFNCDSFDYVNIYDGEYIGLNNIGTFCGDNFCSESQSGFYPSEAIQSTGRCLTMNFETDGSVRRPGFLARINSGNEVSSQTKNQKYRSQGNLTSASGRKRQKRRVKDVRFERLSENKAHKIDHPEK